MLAAKTTLPLHSPHSCFSENSNGSVLVFQNLVPVNKFDGVERFLRIKSPAHTITAPAIPKNSTSAQTQVEILSKALPYIQNFRCKTIVVKYWGAAMTSEALKASVIADIVLLSCVCIRIFFVHGGGPEINQWLGKLGMKPIFLHGLRVTDASTMEIVAKVLTGKNKLVALINKAGGLSEIDDRLLTAQPSPNALQLGFVGDIASA